MCCGGGWRSGGVVIASSISFPWRWWMRSVECIIPPPPPREWWEWLFVGGGGEMDWMRRWWMMVDCHVFRAQPRIVDDEGEGHRPSCVYKDAVVPTVLMGWLSGSVFLDFRPINPSWHAARPSANVWALIINFDICCVKIIMVPIESAWRDDSSGRHIVSLVNWTADI